MISVPSPYAQKIIMEIRENMYIVSNPLCLGKWKVCVTAMRALTDILLQLTDVVPGRYVFSLRVTDEQGETHEDTISVIVKNGK